MLPMPTKAKYTEDFLEEVTSRPEWRAIKKCNQIGDVSSGFACISLREGLGDSRGFPKPCQGGVHGS